MFDDSVAQKRIYIFLVFLQTHCAGEFTAQWPGGVTHLTLYYYIGPSNIMDK